MEENKSFAIYHDLVVNTSLEKVFNAVSKPKHLINWWPLKCTGNPTVGEEYNFYFTPEYDWLAEVIKCIPNESFHIKMTKSDPTWDSTSFGFDLTSVNDRVQIKFWHIGWKECDTDFRRSSFCWAMLLNSLKNYLEKGIVIPFEDRE